MVGEPSSELLNQKGESAHPFDNPRVLAMLEKYFPQHLAAIQKAARPGLSPQSGELERWEASRLLARKQYQPVWEPDLSYLARLLYEETF